VDQDDDDDVPLDSLKAARARDKAADAREVAARRRIETASEFSPHDNDAANDEEEEDEEEEEEVAETQQPEKR
jgi:hypothetical protein